MSTWNYRIVHYRAGGYGLHEVFYGDEGLPFGMTEGAVGFTCDDINDPGSEIYNEMIDAINEAQSAPIFEEPEVWPGRLETT